MAFTKINENSNFIGDIGNDAELIAKDILKNILDNAVQLSEHCTFNQLLKMQTNSFNKNVQIEDEKLNIDISRTYLEEFKSMQKYLKSFMLTDQQLKDPIITNQLKKVVYEIRTLLSLNNQVNGTGDTPSVIVNNFTQNLETVTNLYSPIETKSAITDLLYIDKETNTNVCQLPSQNFQDFDDEIVLHVIDLSTSNTEFSPKIIEMPSDEEIKEVNMNQISVSSSMQSNNLESSPRIITMPPDEEMEEIDLNQSRSSVEENEFNNNLAMEAGEIGVDNPVPDPEPGEKLEHFDGDKIKKKRGFGTRLFNFFSRPRPKSAGSILVQSSTD